MSLSVETGSIKRRTDGYDAVEFIVKDESAIVVARPTMLVEPDGTGVNLKTAALTAQADAERERSRKTLPLPASGVVVDLTPAVKSTEPQDVIDRRAFQVAYGRYQRLVRGRGIVSDQDISDALDAAQKLYRPEYEAFL